MTWREDALEEIRGIHKHNPDATAEELRKILRSFSGDFHGGTSWGKKVWPKACAEYIAKKFGVSPPGRGVEDSPLFNAADHAFPYRSPSSGSMP